MEFMRIPFNNHSGRRAVTLMELLCVLAIIAILMAIYLPAIARAFVHVKKVLFGL
jgi:prepilin-type N-terminal cleavage/methylation domain-containing protein